MSLQEHFFRHSAEPHKFFKYNHFVFVLWERLENITFHAEDEPDANCLIFDLRRNDFSAAFVDYVVLPKTVLGTEHNPTLRRETECDGFVRYRVLPPTLPSDTP